MTGISVEVTEQQSRREDIEQHRVSGKLRKGLIVIEESGQIVSVNPYVEAFFGYSLDELIGENISMLMPKPHKSLHADYIRAYLETGNSAIIGIGREVEGQHKDGHTFNFHLAVGEIKIGQQSLFTGVIDKLDNDSTD